MKRWWFSLVLLAGYLATFHLWLRIPEALVPLTGVVATCVLASVGWRALLAAYFVNRWDRLFHAIVILDVLVEAFIPLHEGHGFYGCAAGFALTVGGYRSWAVRRTVFVRAIPEARR